MKSSILLSFLIWTFFFIAVFGTRYLFSLPSALPSAQLIFIWIGGLLIVVLLRFVIWLFRKHRYKWILSAIINLAILLILLIKINSAGFNQEHSKANEPIVKERVIEENGQQKEMTLVKTKTISKGYHEWFLTYLIILGIVYIVVAMIELNENKVNQILLKESLATAKLNTLRAQLNPHFMFNALNTVSSLMEEDTKEAQQVLEGFSFLLRDMIDKSEKQFVTLEEEIAFIKKYVFIEKKRFDEKLEIQFFIAENTLKGKVPTMILQPLVENAIKHGVLKKEGKGNVSITSMSDEDRLILKIEDDGAGVFLDKVISRVGLNNTRNRLQNLYNDQAKFELKNRSESGALAIINIPFEIE